MGFEFLTLYLPDSETRCCLHVYVMAVSEAVKIRSLNHSKGISAANTFLHSVSLLPRTGIISS